MRNLLILMCFSISGLVCLGQPGKSFNEQESSKVKALADEWKSAWNTHDMERMGNMLTEDVDFINVAGIWMKGRKAAIADHKQKHEGIVFKNSIWTNDSLEVKYLDPELALVHVCWGIKGDNDPDGTPRKPRHGIFTWLAQKREGQWKLLAVHNVNVRE